MSEKLKDKFKAIFSSDPETVNKTAAKITSYLRKTVSIKQVIHADHCNEFIKDVIAVIDNSAHSDPVPDISVFLNLITSLQILICLGDAHADLVYVHGGIPTMLGVIRAFPENEKLVAVAVTSLQLLSRGPDEIATLNGDEETTEEEPKKRKSVLAVIGGADGGGKSKKKASTRMAGLLAVDISRVMLDCVTNFRSNHEICHGACTLLYDVVKQNVNKKGVMEKNLDTQFLEGLGTVLSRARYLLAKIASGKTNKKGKDAAKQLRPIQQLLVRLAKNEALAACMVEHGVVPWCVNLLGKMNLSKSTNSRAVSLSCLNILRHLVLLPGSGAVEKLKQMGTWEETVYHQVQSRLTTTGNAVSSFFRPVQVLLWGWIKHEYGVLGPADYNSVYSSSLVLSSSSAALDSGVYDMRCGYFIDLERLQQAVKAFLHASLPQPDWETSSVTTHTSSSSSSSSSASTNQNGGQDHQDKDNDDNTARSLRASPSPPPGNHKSLAGPRPSAPSGSSPHKALSSTPYHSSPGSAGMSLSINTSNSGGGSTGPLSERSQLSTRNSFTNNSKAPRNTRPGSPYLAYSDQNYSSMDEVGDEDKSTVLPALGGGSNSAATAGAGLPPAHSPSSKRGKTSMRHSRSRSSGRGLTSKDSDVAARHGSPPPDSGGGGGGGKGKKHRRGKSSAASASSFHHSHSASSSDSKEECGEECSGAVFTQQPMRDPTPTGQPVPPDYVPFSGCPPLIDGEVDVTEVSPELWDPEALLSQNKLKFLAQQVYAFVPRSPRPLLPTPELVPLLSDPAIIGSAPPHATSSTGTSSKSKSGTSKKSKGEVLQEFSPQQLLHEMYFYRQRFAPHKPRGFKSRLVYDRVALDEKARLTGFSQQQNLPPTCDHLEFESRFESGNLCRAFQVGPFEYDLLLSHDINTHGKTQWFFFRLRNMVVGKKYKLNIVNMEKRSSSFNKGMCPVMFSLARYKKKGIAWRRARAEGVAYYSNHWPKLNSHHIADKVRMPSCAMQGDDDKEDIVDSDEEEVDEGKEETASSYLDPDQCYCTLTFTLTFSEPNDSVFLSHFYPYTCTHLSSSLHYLQAHCTTSCMVRQPLCYSYGGNMVELLTITDLSVPPSVIAQRPVIVLTCRVHPGEANASWVMQGLLCWLCGDSQKANQLRSRVVFKIVPCLNPDGVILGNYRCSLLGVDLNRHWEKPNINLHPPIYFAKSLLKQLHASRRVILFCDFHGHSNMPDFTLYGCDPAQTNSFNARVPNIKEKKTEDTQRWMGVVPPGEPAKEKLFPTLISRHGASLFQLSACTYNITKTKLGSARVVVWRELRLWNSFTLEASFYGSSFGRFKGTHYSLHDYQEMGKSFALAAADLAEPDKKAAKAAYAKIKASLAAAAMTEASTSSKSSSSLSSRLSDPDINP
mmetsp:Transcript_37375/g.73512  ORF Transcript_37375/g.73512 Transcript_37375/m.73512 type:complete len:1404 (-) Transcript_37375:105-4316(-)